MGGVAGYASTGAHWGCGEMVKTVAALYVEADGCYAGLPDVDCWPESRDARLYGGPHPVVAHPPCNRWSLMSACRNLRTGEDGGCFSAALAAVRNHGGVLEHPAFSMAWRWFGLCQPPVGGVWVWADWLGGWTCYVEQGRYGHECPKATWLYAVGVDLPSLAWGPSGALGRVENLPGPGADGHAHRRARTPEPFRDLLLSMARSVPR